jgi:hypothetical protein
MDASEIEVFLALAEELHFGHAPPSGCTCPSCG